MRIAMMTNNYKPVVGGVPISIDRLSNALRARGHHVTIFAPNTPGQQPERDVVRYRSRHQRLDTGMVIPQVLDSTIEREFVAGGFDLIHVHHPMLIGYSAMALSKKYNVPLAFTYHTRYEQYLHHIGPYAALSRTLPKAAQKVQSLVSRHNKVFTNHCDLVFAPTPLMSSFLEEHGTDTPIAVLPTGLGEQDYARDIHRSAQLRARFLEGKQQLFCSVSRLEDEKNISFLLRSMAGYKASYSDSFRLLLIGDGSRKEALRREAEQLGLKDNILFLGNIPHDDLPYYYGACDLFLFASQSETQGIVLLEAMAAGLPVVALTASGVCDIVEDGRNGWMIAGDEAAMAVAVGSVMEHPVHLEQLRRGAEATAAAYTCGQMAATAESCYRDVIAARVVERVFTPKRVQTKQNMV